MLESHMARIITIFSGISGFARLPVPVYKSDVQLQLSNKPVKIPLARPEMVGSYWVLEKPAITNTDLMARIPKS